MNELPEPSPWFNRHFGEHSQSVMLALANLALSRRWVDGSGLR